MKNVEFKVGDLCTCAYKDAGSGVIYRVIEKPASGNLIKIKPVLGFFTVTQGKRVRELSASWCKPLSLIDLATTYNKFGLFIANEAKRPSGAVAEESEGSK